MKTKDLIGLIDTHVFDCSQEEKELYYEIVARLRELDEIRAIITNPHLTHDYTMEELIKKLKSGK